MVHESRAPVASSAGMRGSIVRRGGARVDVGGEELGGDEVSQVVEPDMAEAEPVAERSIIRTTTTTARLWCRSCTPEE